MQARLLNEAKFRHAETRKILCASDLTSFAAPGFDVDVHVVLDRIGRFFFLLERWSPCLATELCWRCYSSVSLRLR